MTFLKVKLQLPTLKKPTPKELIKLVHGNVSEMLEPPNLPSGIDLKTNKLPRTIDDIINDIVNDEFDNITLLEWIYCFFSKADWDKCNPNKSKSTSQRIWQIAQTKEPIKLRLFWRLVTFYVGQDDQVLAPSLAETFSQSFQPQNQKEKLSFKIIQYLKPPSSYEYLANICLFEYLLPDQLLKKQSLPWKITINDQISLVEQIQIYFPDAFEKIIKPNEKQGNLLLTCLENISYQHQLTMVENLLIKVDSKIGSNVQGLVNWLKNNYGLSGNNSRWNELSPDAKLALRKWIGAVNYKDFEKLVDSIIDCIYLETWEKNQLTKRKVFWSNYTDRFERIRILFPSSSVKALKNSIILDDITELIDDNSQDTEVCIFDFDQWFIVEFFRGVGSETRIFFKTDKLENLFFKTKNISLKKLRSLPISINDVHDHRYCWQSDCEKLLRQKNILPNQGINYFKIEEGQKGFPYSSMTGMPPLNQEQLKIRKKQLYYWQQDILKLQQEVGGNTARLVLKKPPTIIIP